MPGACSNFLVTPGAFQSVFKGQRDAFVAKINPKGTGLLYSTFWSGGDPAKQVVTIVGASLSGTIVSSFVCTVGAATGSFTVPKSILRLILPGSSPVAHLPSGLLAVGVQPSPEVTKFSAGGLDAANIQYTIQNIKGVTFR